MNIELQCREAFQQLQKQTDNYWKSEQEWSQNSETSYKDHITNLLKPYPPLIQRRLNQEFFGFGPIDSLVKNQDVTEIVINGPEDIYFEKMGAFYSHVDSFYSQATYESFVHLLCQLSQINYNYNIPCGDGRFENFRVHVISPPLTVNHPQITMRQHRNSPWSLEELQEIEFCTSEQLKLLKKSIKEQLNILVIGPTGVGKTACLNALLGAVSSKERVIAIEDTDELELPNSMSLKLLTRFDVNGQLKNYSQSDLIVQALRMRPHRLVLGEVRGPEAKDLLLALSTGHRGAMCSLHAESARQALMRLEVLVQLGAPQWSVQVVRNLVALGLDLVVTLNFEGSKRKLKSVHSVKSVESFGVTLEQIS